MKTRIITAFIGIVVCVLLMVFGEMLPIIFAIAVAIVNAMICTEFLTAKKMQKNPPILISTILFSLALPLLAGTQIWYIAIYAYTMLMFVSLIFFKDSTSVYDVTFSYAGVILISLSLFCICRMIITTEGWHSFYLVMAVVSAWCADSAAYFTGSYLGKTKLCPNISPKKTVEGVVGGALGSVAGIMLAGVILQFIIYRDMTVNYAALLVIGLYCAVASVLGDLVFSVIKRDCGIKDYGSIMPGHGGLLDRFDSVIFCAPFVYLISETWGLITV